MSANFVIRKTKPRTSRKTGKKAKSEFYFVVKAGNREITGMSETYTERRGVNRGINAHIKAVMEAKDKPILDESVDKPEVAKKTRKKK